MISRTGKTRGHKTPRVVSFSIQNDAEAHREFKAAFEAARGRTPFKPVQGSSFSSLKAVRNFLTPKRLELLHLVKTKEPRSIYALAKLAKREFPSVLRDIDLLSRHGLVKLSRSTQSRRGPVLPEVGYDAIHVWIGV